MKVVIIAGGKGTRLSPYMNNVPKPMIIIDNKPVLEHTIDCLRGQGFQEIIITVGYCSDMIINYFGDGSKISPATGRAFGVHIHYYVEEKPLGNAGALIKIRKILTDDFLLINADILFDINFERFISFHKGKRGLVTLYTHPNSHPYDSGLIVSDENNRVQKWIGKGESRPLYYKNRVNAGIHIINPQVLDAAFTTEEVDLDSQLFLPLVKTGEMYCYDCTEYVKDMGTPERYFSVCNDYRAGIVSKKNIGKLQKAIFLDPSIYGQSVMK